MEQTVFLSCIGINRCTLFHFKLLGVKRYRKSWFYSESNLCTTGNLEQILGAQFRESLFQQRCLEIGIL